MGKGLGPIDAARANLDIAVPILTGDLSTTAEDIVNRSEAKPQLEKLSDKELLTAAARQTLVTFALVEQELNAHVAELVANKPRETAVLIKALAEMSEAASGAFRELYRLPTS